MNVRPEFDPKWVEQGEVVELSFTGKPTAPVGTVVRGTLYVCSHAWICPSLGSELVGIPYAYTVG